MVHPFVFFLFIFLSGVKEGVKGEGRIHVDLTQGSWIEKTKRTNVCSTRVFWARRSRDAHAMRDEA